MTEKYTVASLWIGPELSWIEQVCLMSFLRHGHRTILYTYDDVIGIPDGVERRDAREILPDSDIIYHKRTGSPAFHSDIFRLRMLEQTDFLWVDTDAYCLKPFERNESGFFFGWGSEEKPLLYTGVLGLPKDSQTLKQMLDLVSDRYPVPPWLPERRQEKLRQRKAAGKGLHVSEMQWGVLGPEALTYFGQETGEAKYAFPGHVLYPVPFGRANWFFWPSRRNDIYDYELPETLSYHFFGRRLRNILGRHKGELPEESYCATLLKEYGIDPKETAHLFVEWKRPEKAAKAAALKEVSDE